MGPQMSAHFLTFFSVSNSDEIFFFFWVRMLLAQENSTISPQFKHPEAELLSRQEKRERKREVFKRGESPSLKYNL